MADRRMFNKQIIDSDAFLDMPLSTQALYFHLAMRADDDGFVDNPKKIQKIINASPDDLKVLDGKRYILTFESGVIVIKHWRLHNTLRFDRYKKTSYLEERSQLGIKENKSYTEIKNIKNITWQPDGNHCEPQISIDKISIDKISIDIVEEIISYLNMKANTSYKYSTASTKKHISARLTENYTIDNFKNVIDKKVKEWRGTEMEKYIRPETLFGTKFENYLNQKDTPKKKNSFNNISERDYDYAEMERKLLEK